MQVEKMEQKTKELQTQNRQLEVEIVDFNVHTVLSKIVADAKFN